MRTRGKSKRTQLESPDAELTLYTTGCGYAYQKLLSHWLISPGVAQPYGVMKHVSSPIVMGSNDDALPLGDVPLSPGKGSGEEPSCGMHSGDPGV